jgi:hypothetical protein
MFTGIILEVTKFRRDGIASFQAYALKRTVTTINVHVGTQSNTTCCSFSNGVYCTLSYTFQPIYNGHLQAPVLGVIVVTTLTISNRASYI